MGLGLSQIINKLLPTQEQGAIGWDNPLGMAQGQILTSNSEALLQFYARKGLLKCKSVQEVTFSSSTSFAQVLSTPSPATGKTQYALKLIIGGNGTALANLNYQKDDIKNNTTESAWFYLPANQSIMMDFNGGGWCLTSTGLQVNARVDNTTTKISATLYYVEV